MARRPGSDSTNHAWFTAAIRADEPGPARVRVEPPGQAAVGVADLVGGGRRCHAELLVVGGGDPLSLRLVGHRAPGAPVLPGGPVEEPLVDQVAPQRRRVGVPPRRAPGSPSPRCSAAPARTPGPAGRARPAASSAPSGSTAAARRARTPAAPWRPRPARRGSTGSGRPRPTPRPPGPPPRRPSPRRCSVPSPPRSTSPAADQPGEGLARPGHVEAGGGHDVVERGGAEDQGRGHRPPVVVGQQPGQAPPPEQRAARRSIAELGVDRPDQLLAPREAPHVLR